MTPSLAVTDANDLAILRPDVPLPFVSRPARQAVTQPGAI